VQPDGFARVVVDVSTRALSTAFDYRVPASLSQVAQVGCPVLVEFSGRKLTGWIIERPETSEYPDAKEIIAVLGPSYFSARVAKIAGWIAEEYVAPLAEAIRLFLPPGISFRPERVQGDEAEVWRVQSPAANPSSERWVELADRDYSPRKGASVQQAILCALAAGPVRMAELRESVGPSLGGAVSALEATGAVRITEKRRFRRPDSRTYAAERPEQLSAGQRQALERIDSIAADGGGVLVLEGITGSGKTEVYMQAIEAARSRGKGAIVLVPEISLTPQTVGRFRSRFGEDVAVLHSRLSAGERLDEWDRVRDESARIVVGARSALFAPVVSVGLIIIDEEHESSYKQGSSPRYHAREVAERMAQDLGAVLVLGSATPSMEALHRVEEGHYSIVRLTERVGGASPPAVSVVDMTMEFAEGHRSMFSRKLTKALQRVIAERQKAVLLLNRRGFASFLLCRECGYVPMCDSCSVSMTYHHTSHSLACHHCAARRSVPVTCPDCDSVYLRKFGAGTQRVESELATLYPELPVIRMDADTTRGKSGHDRCLARFEALEWGVLLGTQMVAKGLDYPEVTLVGVLDADTILRLPDFRSAERTNQLLEQVAGRAGRGLAPGEVVIQTYQPRHRAIAAVASGNRTGFLADEGAERSELGYPPFGRLANVLFTGSDEKLVKQAATIAAERLYERAGSDLRVLGPSSSPISRINRAYRWHILVKASHAVDMPAVLRETLGDLRFKGVKLGIDVDCLDIL